MTRPILLSSDGTKGRERSLNRDGRRGSRAMDVVACNSHLEEVTKDGPSWRTARTAWLMRQPKTARRRSTTLVAEMNQSPREGGESPPAEVCDSPLRCSPPVRQSQQLMATNARATATSHRDAISQQLIDGLPSKPGSALRKTGSDLNQSLSLLSGAGPTYSSAAAEQRIRGDKQ